MIKDKDGNNLTPFELQHREVQALESIAESLRTITSEGYNAMQTRAFIAESKLAEITETIKKRQKEINEH